MLQYFQEKNQKNLTYTDNMRALQHTISTQQTELSNIQKIIDKLLNKQPTTPNSLEHHKKKSRPTPSIESSANNAVPRNITYSKTNKAHQLESLYVTQDISMIADKLPNLSHLQNKHFPPTWDTEQNTLGTDESHENSQDNCFQHVTKDPGNPPGEYT
jgi:hypothetical protein